MNATRNAVGGAASGIAAFLLCSVDWRGEPFARIGTVSASPPAGAGTASSAQAPPVPSPHAYPALRRVLTDNGGYLSDAVKDLMARPDLLIEGYAADPAGFFQALDEATRDAPLDATVIVSMLSDYCDVPQMAFDWLSRDPARLKREEMLPVIGGIAFRADPDLFVSELLPKSVAACDCSPLADSLILSGFAPSANDGRTHPADSGKALETALKTLRSAGQLDPGRIPLIPRETLSGFSPETRVDFGVALVKAFGEGKLEAKFFEAYSPDELKRCLTALGPDDQAAGAHLVALGLSAGTLPIADALELTKDAQGESGIHNLTGLLSARQRVEASEALDWIGAADGREGEDPGTLIRLAAEKATDPLRVYEALLADQSRADSSERADLFSIALVEDNPSVAAVMFKEALDRGGRISDAAIGKLAISQIGFDDAAARAWAAGIRDEGERGRVESLIPHN